VAAVSSYYYEFTGVSIDVEWIGEVLKFKEGVALER